MSTPIVVSASFSGPAIVGSDPSKLPDDIQWMPPGRHVITPFVDGETQTFEINVTPALASRMATGFQTLLSRAAAGEGDVPYFDFNHDDAEASGHPTEIYWGGDDAKAGGIRAKVKWTSAGTASLQGRTYRRFSPQWLMVPETYEPIGLGVNMGALVNRAAFKTIQPVVAKGGDPKEKNMTEADKAELSQLIAAALQPLAGRITTLEATAKSAAGFDAAAVTAATGKIAGLEERLKTVEASAKTNATATAKSAVAVHAKRGAFPPANADLIAFYEASYIANPEGTEKALAAMPSNAALAAQYVIGGAKGADATPATGDPKTAEGFVAQVKAKCADGKTSQADALKACIAANAEGYKAWRDAKGEPGLN